MKIKGINDLEEKIILEILHPYFKEFNFYYYGSRVKGDFRPLSDLDILIKGKTPVSSEMIDCLKQGFDESDLPFIVNFIDYHSISTEFYNTIKSNLISVN